MKDYVFIVNLQKTPLDRTLGVLRFMRGVLNAVRDRSRFVFLVAKPETVARSPIGDLVEEGDHVLDVADLGALGQQLKALSLQGAVVELCAHHFQPRLTEYPSITILHDFHAFTVPWKYHNAPAVQSGLIENLAAADAVVTHFPYSYFEYKTFTGISPNKVFLVRSPLLLDDAVVSEQLARNRGRPAGAHGDMLFYPAQFQEHKNHLRLLDAVETVAKERPETSLVLTGTQFSGKHSAAVAQRIGALTSCNIAKLGHVSDAMLHQLYSSAALTVVPSLAEGGAYVPLEALLFGGPVVLSNLPSAVAHLRSLGLHDQLHLFDPNDTSSIVEAITAGLDPCYAERCRLISESFQPALWRDLQSDLIAIADFVLGAATRPLVQITAAHEVLDLLPGDRTNG